MSPAKPGAVVNRSGHGLRSTQPNDCLYQLKHETQRTGSRLHFQRNKQYAGLRSLFSTQYKGGAHLIAHARFLTLPFAPIPSSVYGSIHVNLY